MHSQQVSAGGPVPSLLAAGKIENCPWDLEEQLSVRIFEGQPQVIQAVGWPELTEKLRSSSNPLKCPAIEPLA
jgi:hypothetical protein